MTLIVLRRCVYCSAPMRPTRAARYCHRFNCAIRAILDHQRQEMGLPVNDGGKR